MPSVAGVEMKLPIKWGLNTYRKKKNRMHTDWTNDDIEISIWMNGWKKEGWNNEWTHDNWIINDGTQ